LLYFVVEIKNYAMENLNKKKLELILNDFADRLFEQTPGVKITENMIDKYINSIDCVKSYYNNIHDYAWCDECEKYIHENNQKWIGVDLAICPYCSSNLEK